MLSCELVEEIFSETNKFQLKALNQKQYNETLYHMHTENERDLSQRYYNTLFENSGVAIAVLDNDLIILTVNSDFEDLSGYLEDELIGVNAQTNFFSSESFREIEKRCVVSRLNLDKSMQKFEIQCIDREGNVRIIMAHLSIVPDVENIILALHDITEKRKLELLLKESDERFRMLFEQSLFGGI